MSDVDRRDSWLSIELRHLTALSAIETEGTFSEAALSLGYVQSAVSGQLATLERLIGMQLVERSRGTNPQRLTPAGVVLLGHAREIMNEFETARNRLQARALLETNGLRLSVSPAWPDRLLTPVLGGVLGTPMGVEVARARTVEQDDLHRALADGEVDIALTALPVSGDDVATAELTRQPAVLVVHPESPLALRRRAPTLKDVVRLPLIAWREGGDPSLIEHQLAERSLRASVAVRAESSDTVASLVRAGVGAAILPRNALADDTDLAVVELADALPPRVLGLAWSRSRVGDSRVRAFIGLACRLRDSL